MNGAVRNLSWDSWNGVFCEEQNIPSPSADDAKAALQRLDAKAHTLMTLHAEDGSQLGVGGGGGRYVVYLQTADEVFWNLLSGAEGEGVEALNAGGQVGEYPAIQVVDLAQARRAMETFFRTGSRDAALAWELQ